jgi:hypothetical protein
LNIDNGIFIFSDDVLLCVNPANPPAKVSPALFENLFYGEMPAKNTSLL